MLKFFFDLADDKMIDDKNGVSLPSEKKRAATPSRLRVN